MARKERGKREKELKRMEQREKTIRETGKGGRKRDR